MAGTSVSPKWLSLLFGRVESILMALGVPPSYGSRTRISNHLGWTRVRRYHRRCSTQQQQQQQLNQPPHPPSLNIRALNLLHSALWLVKTKQKRNQKKTNSEFSTRHRTMVRVWLVVLAEEEEEQIRRTRAKSGRREEEEKNQPMQRTVRRSIWTSATKEKQTTNPASLRPGRTSNAQIFLYFTKVTLNKFYPLLLFCVLSICLAASFPDRPTTCVTFGAGLWTITDLACLINLF